MASSSSTGTQSGLEARIAALLSGVSKSIPSTSTLQVNGAPMTQPALIAQLQTCEALYSDVTTARDALAAKIAARQQGLAGARAFVDAVVTAVKASLGQTSPLLTTFGIALPKARAARTVEEKAISAAKARATRQLRGTTSKKQKAAITGQGKPGIVVTGVNGQPLPGATTAVPPVGLQAVPQPAANTSNNSTPSTTPSPSTSPAKN